MSTFTNALSKIKQKLFQRGPWPAVALVIVAISIAASFFLRRNSELVLALDTVVLCLVGYSLTFAGLRKDGNAWSGFMDFITLVLAAIAAAAAWYQ